MEQFALPRRAWCAADSSGMAVPKTNDAGLLIVATFNVLAEAFEYSGSPWDCWLARRARLLDTALQEEPDILCLQEVDHFDDFFEPELRHRGYVGFFVPKTKKPMNPHLPTEGQAIFIRDEKFDVVRRHCWTSVDLRGNKRLLNLWRSSLRPDDDYNIVFGTDAKLQMLPQIVLGLVLRPRLVTGRCPDLLCMSVHLKSTVKQQIIETLGVSAEDLKLHQFQYFVRSARELVGNNMPVLCCGDFNQSMSASGLRSTVSHHGFVDAYCGDTSWGRSDPIDFILLGGGLIGVQYLGLPTPAQLHLERGGRLPNEVYPSDHLLRAARVSMQQHPQDSLFDRVTVTAAPDYGIQQHTKDSLCDRVTVTAAPDYGAARANSTLCKKDLDEIESAGGLRRLPEKRVDPDDGSAYTWEEFSAYYKQHKYKKGQIASYWETCNVLQQKKTKGKGNGEARH